MQIERWIEIEIDMEIVMEIDMKIDMVMPIQQEVDIQIKIKEKRNGGYGVRITPINDPVEVKGALKMQIKCRTNIRGIIPMALINRKLKYIYKEGHLTIKTETKISKNDIKTKILSVVVPTTKIDKSQWEYKMIKFIVDHIVNGKKTSQIYQR